MRSLVLLLALVGLAVSRPPDIGIKPDVCAEGYTGAGCQNPICYDIQTIDNHDAGELGDMIFWDYSQGCKGEYQFFVDEFVQNITVFARGGSGFLGNVYKNDKVVKPLGTPPPVPSGTAVAQFDFIDNPNRGGPGGYGAYSLIVTSDGTQNCEIFITSPTRLMIDGGFVPDRRDDHVQTVVPEPNQGVGRNPIINNASYFAFQMPKVLTHPGRPTSAFSYILGTYGTNSYITDRYGCSATLLAGPFTCTAEADTFMHIKVKGVDTKGNTWERVYKYYCESGIPPTPTTPPIPTECRNGGLMVNQGTPQQECYCGPFYEGNNCEIKRCLNNGHLGKYDRCECSAGFSGEHCQHVVCDKRVEGYEDLNQRSITFVVRTGQSMNGHINEILKAADRIYGYYSNGPNSTYIQQWVLVTVGGGAIDIQNVASFQLFRNAIIASASTAETQCEDTVLTAISEAISNYAVQIYKRSLIFVFSDGMPKDFDIGQTLMHQLSFFRGQIFFMLADSITKQCEIEPAHGGYWVMRWLAMFSHGQVAYVKMNELAMATYVLAVSAHKADHIMSNDLMDSCQRAPEYMTFFVDPNMRHVFISATGTNLSITIINPARETVNPAPFYVPGTGNLYVWNLRDLKYGGYLLQLKSTSNDPCSIRVFGFGDTSLWVGITHKETEDAVVQQPVYMDKSFLVAKINNLRYGDPTDLHADVTIWTNQGYNDRRTVLYASRGVYRDGCDFHLFFGDFRCTYANTMYYVNVFVTDSMGFVVQRSYTGFCSLTETTETPPEGCMNGGYPVTTDQGNRTCLCPAHYTGDKCQNLQCLNMGTPMGASCECISEYTGQFCEISTCYQMNKQRTFSPNGRSLTLIIHDSIQTRSAIRNIKQQMPALIQDVTHQHKYWITSYEIYRFNDTSFTRVVNSANPNDFLAGINALNESNSAASDPSCANLTVLPGLVQALMSPGLTYEGIIYLYMAGYMRVNFGNLNEVEAIYELLETSRVMFNVVMMAGQPCGTELNSPETRILMNFAAFTGGQYIMVMPGNAGATLRSVPTLYRNNYIYDNFVADCTTKQTFYFPVDSQMQSFTVSILGEIDESSLAYYDPSGNVKRPFTIWTDTGMSSRMDQIIRECDEGWDLHGVRCWKIMPVAATWTEARDNCHGNDAVVITILNKAEQDYADSVFNGADYWIGLNNLENIDTFVWDTNGDQTLTLDNTGYKNWAAGQPVKDADKRCAFDKRYVGWSMDNCNTGRRAYVCVKHAYDADYEVDFGNLADLLPRGIWKTTFKTKEGACNVQIYGQSGIQLYTQYVTNVHNDFGTEQPNARATDNRVIAHTTNQNPIGQGVSGVLEYSHFYFFNMSIVEAMTYSMRDTKKCSYEYLSTPYRCPSTSYLSLSTGIDRFGYLYQRIESVSCFKGPIPEECKNGAVFNNGKCICPPYWEGDFCERPLCQHGELNSLKTKCTCYRGYTGPICDIPVCNRGGSGQITIPTAANRTFIVAIDGSQNYRMSLVAAEWDGVLTAVLNKAGSFPNWFTHFTGVVFRDSTAAAPLSDLIESDDSTDFKTKLLAELQKPYTPTVTTRNTISGIARALSSPFIQPRSFLWVITGSNAEDYAGYPKALDAAARVHAYVNFLIIDDQKPPGDVLYNDTSLDSYYDLMIQTSGQFYQVANDAAGMLGPFWSGLFSNYYRAYFLTTRNLWDCSHGLVEYVQMSSNATTLIVDATGSGTVNIWDPLNNQKDPVKVVSSKTNKVYVLAIETPTPGLWKVQVPGWSGFCRVEVRMQSDIDVFLGYVHDGEDFGVHSNDVDYRPHSTDTNSVVVHTDSGTINFVQMFTADERALLWSSPMEYRRQCPYEFISSYQFICTDPSLSVAIEGTDANGYPFRRMTHTHCVGNFGPTRPPIHNGTNLPPTTPPLTTLQPLTCGPDAKFDVILVFDSSTGVHTYDFEEIVRAFSVLPSQMTIDADHMQFMIGSYSEDVFWANDAAVIKDSATFASALSMLRTYGYDGKPGNNIASIFSRMDSSWFRSSTSPVVVLFSSVAWDAEQVDGHPLYNDPQPMADAFWRNGGKILPIGYGPLADASMLSALGKGCDRIAANQAQAVSMIPWIISAMCSSQPYCSPATL